MKDCRSTTPGGARVETWPPPDTRIAICNAYIRQPYYTAVTEHPSKISGTHTRTHHHEHLLGIDDIYGGRNAIHDCNRHR